MLGKVVAFLLMAAFAMLPLAIGCYIGNKCIKASSRSSRLGQPATKFLTFCLLSIYFLLYFATSIIIFNSKASDFGFYFIFYGGAFTFLGGAALLIWHLIVVYILIIDKP